MGVLSWVGIYPMTFQLLMFAGFLYSFMLIPKYRIRSYLDLSTICYIIYIFLNAIAIQYPHRLEMWKTELFYSILPITFYFIFKTTDINFEHYIKKMFVPMTIVMVIGIILYVYNPPWYSALKYAQLFESYGYTENHVPDKILREAFRLSSIWNTPYVIGYANSFFIIYLLKQLLTGNLYGRDKKIHILLFLLSFLVLILAGFKSLLLSFVLSVFIFLMFMRDHKKQLKLLIGSFIFLLLTVFIIACVDAEYYDFFIERFLSTISKEGMSERLNHTGGGIQLNSVFGAGLGKYGMAAKDFNGWFIQDSQYQKVLAELGIVGFTIFICVLLSAVISAWSTKSLLPMCVVITYMVSFIGSSSISAETTFPFIFWSALGVISKNSAKGNARKFPTTACI